MLADCRLIGSRTLPNQSAPQVTTHFKARVRLTRQPLPAVHVPALGEPTGHVVESADIYRLYFHGPAYQVVKRTWWDGKRIVGLMASGLRNNHEPAGLPTIAAPRFIELCFQTAGIWEMGIQGRMGLPLGIGRVSLVRNPETAEGDVFAVVTPHPDKECFDAEVVDSKGNCYLSLSAYRTVAVPGGIDAEPLKVLQRLMANAALQG